MRTFSLLWFMLLLISAAPAAAENSAGGYVPAAVCGACHAETFESWARTFHALSVIDPIYAEALERAEKVGGEEGRKTCLPCHAPTTNLSGDFSLTEAVTREGVTCSFCHSVTAVDHSQPLNRFTNDPDRLKIPVGSEGMADHHFEDHNILLGSEFCAGCHEWTNSKGLVVLSTYSEWKESFYAGEKVVCQQCHMPESLGGEAANEGSKTPEVTNLHYQMGGHSQDQLVAAASMDLTVDRLNGSITVDAAITNFKAGHKLPTGIPNRRMRLTVELFDRQGQFLDSREQVYRRVIAGDDGRILEDAADLFLLGATEVSDNRILPKETRKETFTFTPTVTERFVLVEASLDYEIPTPYLDPPLLTFSVVKKRVPLELGSTSAGKSFPTAALFIIVSLFLFVTTVMIAILRRGAADGDTRKE